jgi:hypothetical protein
LWIWLSLHLEHFSLTFSAGHFGALTYLPIGAALLPLASLRSGIKRMRLFGDGKFLEIILFYCGYELILFLAAILSHSDGISANVKYIPLISVPMFFLAWLTTLEKTPPVWQWIKTPIAIILAIGGVASIIYGITLFLHIHLVTSLALVDQPGWVGGIALLLLQILYIPNVIVAEISYSLGFGYSLGAHTHIAPKWYEINQTPSLQSLGALPHGVHPVVLYSIIGYVLIFAIYQIGLRRNEARVFYRVRNIFFSTIATSLFLLAVSYLSGGELLTSQLSPVGVRYWPIASSFATLSVALLFLVVLFPALVSSSFNHYRARKEIRTSYE